ncbi:disulfide bond formation protein B [Iodobacter arcticus]|uniref:Disulfide bond formation protein B n=1 Tax=Iodobacter arcticus TaxID=590593 RepID=A0ABW2R3L8_9NEIS
MPYRPSPSTPASDSACWMLIFIAWLIAASSTLGALFFGEVMGMPPCTLCWYQRIFMFPLAIFLPLALFPLDTKVARYALPLALIGLGFAVFHWFLQLGFISPSASPCAQGSSCSEVEAEWFGFLTMPLMSVCAFALISISLFATFVQGKK